MAWPNRRPNGAGRQHRPRKLADEAGRRQGHRAPGPHNRARAREWSLVAGLACRHLAAALLTKDAAAFGVGEWVT